MLNSEEIKNKYFDWLYDYMCKGKISRDISYRKLFRLLFDIPFEYYLVKDGNRAVDGTDLRYRFALYMGNESICDILDEPCSVLEMMEALAIRCEETIMTDTRYGDRTVQWFWDMLTNLGIRFMTDEKFDEKLATKKIYDFMERRYGPDGKGGLFYIRGSEVDLSQIEIWSQLSLYLNNYV